MIGYTLKDVINELDRKHAQLRGQVCTDPEDAAYDDGYASALEFAMVVIEEMLGEEE